MYNDLSNSIFERVVSLQTCMNEINQSHFQFQTAQIFLKKVNGILLQY